VYYSSDRADNARRKATEVAFLLFSVSTDNSAKQWLDC